MIVVFQAPWMPEPLEIEAVIFDMDGLLIDSEGLAADAWRHTLAAYNATISDEEIKAMFGRRIVDDAAYLIREYSLPVTVEALVAQRNAAMRTLLQTTLRPMPGAVELVQWLREHGVPLALATSGQRWYAEQSLRAVGLDEAFAIRITGDNVMHGKPDPEIFQAAAERLGVAPSACLVLEDAPLGVAAANAAGMPVVAVPNEHTSRLAFPPALATASSLAVVSSWMTVRQSTTP